MSAADGGPAFPQNDAAVNRLNNHDGMTLRDYFAAKAMQTLLGRVYSSPRDIANAAYGMADEMLIAGAT